MLSSRFWWPWAFQVGTNYVNDYADGVRGTDEHRVGPVRLVASKLATVREVKLAALISFAARGTGGPRGGSQGHVVADPSGSAVRARGGRTRVAPGRTGTWDSAELFVFLFSDWSRRPVRPTCNMPRSRPLSRATSSRTTTTGGSSSGPVCPSDCWPPPSSRPAICETSQPRGTESGKKTLAVRLGRRRAGLFYCFTLAGVVVSIAVLHGYRAWSLLALLALPLAVEPVRLALGDQDGRALLPMLGTTARLQIVAGALDPRFAHMTRGPSLRASDARCATSGRAGPDARRDHHRGRGRQRHAV